MEAIIVIVGFLGAGKTTLLKRLVSGYIDAGWNPFVILNDYENAYLDAQQLDSRIEPKGLKPLNGSCICCSGIAELRDYVNRIPERENGITLIEANGTTDACELMEFLGVGIDKRFLPPIQVSVVDVKNWRQRGEHNELEENQVQVSSLIVLSHVEKVSETRVALVTQDLKELNPTARIVTMDELDIFALPELSPSENSSTAEFDHHKAHWASCSIDLPDFPDVACIDDVCTALPESILRVKGFTNVVGQKSATYFERRPDGEVHIRPFNGSSMTGPKLLTVGPGSAPELLVAVVAESLASAEMRES